MGRTPQVTHLDTGFQGDFPQQRDLLQAIRLHSLVHGLAGGEAAMWAWAAQPVSAPCPQLPPHLSTKYSPARTQTNSPHPHPKSKQPSTAPFLLS